MKLTSKQIKEIIEALEAQGASQEEIQEWIDTTLPARRPFWATLKAILPALIVGLVLIGGIALLLWINKPWQGGVATDKAEQNEQEVKTAVSAPAVPGQKPVPTNKIVGAAPQGANDHMIDARDNSGEMLNFINIYHGTDDSKVDKKSIKNGIEVEEKKVDDGTPPTPDNVEILPVPPKGASRLILERSILPGNGTRFQTPIGWNTSLSVKANSDEEFNLRINTGTATHPTWVKHRSGNVYAEPVRIESYWVWSHERQVDITISISPMH